MQQEPGQFAAREIHTGIQGELYTQVLDGVKDGDQVVTFGSFFIDAEQKLKGDGADLASAGPMSLAIIRAVIRWRAAVWFLVAAALVTSLWALRGASLDAIPDISDPQIVVYAKWPRSPQLLETEVTGPLVSALVGSADIQSIRATSHMGYSFIYVILANGASRPRVQQMVLDRVNSIRPQLPSDANISIGPNASSMGWIYQ